MLLSRWKTYIGSIIAALGVGCIAVLAGIVPLQYDTETGQIIYSPSAGQPKNTNGVDITDVIILGTNPPATDINKIVGSVVWTNPASGGISSGGWELQFEANLAGVSQSFLANTLTRVNYTNTVYDLGNFIYTNAAWVVPSNGWYHMWFNWNAVNGYSLFNTPMIYTNGAKHTWLGGGDAYRSDTSVIQKGDDATYIGFFNAGVTVQVYTLSYNQTRALDGDTNLTKWLCFRIPTTE